MIKTKFKAGRYLIPVTMQEQKGRLYIKFPFNQIIINELKAMDGARWDPDRMSWHIPINDRNDFQLEHLQGNNPYAPWDTPLVDITSNRPLYDHQYEMVQHGLTRHYCIYACEMGTGKTLAAIEVAEHIPDQKPEDFWYVGPISGVRAVKLELDKWDAKIRPGAMLTYDGMKKIMRTWEPGRRAPRLVVLDEGSKLKDPNTQQSQMGLALANGVRSDWGDQGYVIIMSGTPAPKTPVDWWHLCEVACPGFIREGNVHKFKRRLALVEQRESMISGGLYPHLIGWRDDEKKCAQCMELKDHADHQPINMGESGYHRFEPSVNEVALLYERMKGLVLVKFKSKCTDLPDKQYEIRNIKPSASTLRTAMLIKKTIPRAVQVLTLCRELSDGFQYVEVATGLDVECPRCFGTKTVTVKQPVTETDTMAPNTGEIEYEDVEITCDNCNGLGVVAQYARDMEEVPCPKDDELVSDLDAHSECGRLIVWGGFRGTIDRIIKLCHSEGWSTLRVDGGGYVGSDYQGNSLNADELLIAMDRSHPRQAELALKHRRLCFVGHPRAGGMALTLTASPTEIFFSNDFSGEARMQAEDRFHRLGMDTNCAAKIIDYIHLPTDRLVLNNLLKKKELQNISMGDLDGVFKERIV